MTAHGVALNFASDRRDGSDREGISDWPAPQPLGGDLPPVPPFESCLMPTMLIPIVEDTADRMQVALDYPAVTSLISLAGATGRRARIQPKSEDTEWIVVPNLWGGIVAPPGQMKSAAINTATAPLRSIEKVWRFEHDSAAAQYLDQKEEMDLRKAAWKESYKGAVKTGKEIPIRPDDSLSVPICRRLITQDATCEKLHELLRDNPAGLMLIHDEMSGWLATLDKPGRESDRGFFLSAWNGDTGYTIDRIGRGSIYVDACCVSMLGGIQPARLRGYLSDALRDGPANDGLFQRFQVLVYPDVTTWRYVDRSPNILAARDASLVYRRLTKLDVDFPRILHFDPEAQQLFVVWITELEAKLRNPGIHPALVSHLAKYRSLMPSLAGLFELADGDANIITLKHAQQAACWCTYLESHALRIYSMLISPERQAAAELGRRIRNGWKRLEMFFSVRDVYRNEWTGLTTPDSVRRVLPILEDADWIRSIEPEQRTTGGRLSEVYEINPLLWRMK